MTILSSFYVIKEQLIKLRLVTFIKCLILTKYTLFKSSHKYKQSVEKIPCHVHKKSHACSPKDKEKF